MSAVLPSMNIGSLRFEIPLFLAPMAGVTDAPFAVLAREMGAAAVFSEMVSIMGLHFKNEHTLEMLRFPPSARPLALQLFGTSPEIAAEVAAFVESEGIADIIDFNMGCPAPKIVKGGAGSALMRNPDLVEEIISAIRRAVKIPITVKIRSGWDKDSINAPEIAKICETAGADAVTVHGRTREEYYTGHSDWSVIARVKRAVKIPVIASGDVMTTTDLINVRNETDCDGVMIGRAADGNPWIFRQMAAFLKSGEESPPPEKSERAELMMRHLDMLIALKGEYIGAREMRKHAMHYVKGASGGRALREEFSHAESRDDFQKILGKFCREDLE